MKLSKTARQRGAVHLLLLVAVIGLIAFVVVSSSGEFKNKLFATLFPNKPSSFAGGISGPIGSTFSVTGKVYLVYDQNNSICDGSKAIPYCNPLWTDTANPVTVTIFKDGKPYGVNPTITLGGNSGNYSGTYTFNNIPQGQYMLGLNLPAHLVKDLYVPENNRQVVVSSSDIVSDFRVKFPTKITSIECQHNVYTGFDGTEVVLHGSNFGQYQNNTSVTVNGRSMNVGPATVNGKRYSGWTNTDVSGEFFNPPLPAGTRTFIFKDSDGLTVTGTCDNGTPGSSDLDKRISDLENQLAGQQSALDRILSWIKSIFPGF